MRFFSGIAFTTLISMTAVMGMSYLKPALSALEAPTAQEVIEGKWKILFEKTFDKTLPVTALSRDIWGRAEYAAFNQGGKDAVTGRAGWLFTAEEFSCPIKARLHMQDNLDYIARVKDEMAARHVRLAIVLIPAKTRVMADHLGVNKIPPCRSHVYEDIRQFLTARDIAVTDLLPAMQASAARHSLYLKTDTHWSPQGARLAAMELAQMLRDVDLPLSSFSTHPAGAKRHEGDLTRYYPGVAFEAENIDTFATGRAVASRDASSALFDDEAPPVTLVGTSYSANASWNFEGFVKEALKTDVLNTANEGLGPFVIMDKYLEDESWKSSPPQLVVWEMPERYFLMPHGKPQG